MLSAKSVTKLFSWPLDACSSIVIFFIFFLLFYPIASIHAQVLLCCQLFEC